MPSYLPPDPLSGLGLPRQRRSRRRQDELRPEEEQSIIGSLGRGALGTLSTVANAIGTGDAVVHNTIDRLTGGKSNPLAPLRHPLSGEGRVSPSEILARKGIIRANDPNKWEWGDVGRFGLDVGLSPSTYLLGMGALTKAGKALSKTGKTTKGFSAGVRAGERGIAEIGIPFTQYRGVVGTGPAVAAKLDKVANFASKIPGVQAAGKVIDPLKRHWGSMMQADKLGTSSKEVQPYAPKLFQEFERIDQQNKFDTLGRLAELHKAGKSTALTHGAVPSVDAQERLLRSQVEHAYNPGTGTRHRAIDDPTGVAVQLRREDRALRQLKRAYGMSGPQGRLRDEILHGTRHSNTKGQIGQGRKSPFSGKDANDKVRDELFKGFRAGTQGVRSLMQDQTVDSLLEASRMKYDDIMKNLKAGTINQTIANDIVNKLREHTVNQVHQHIATAWRGEIKQTFKKRSSSGKVVLNKQGKPIVVDRHRGLAEYLVSSSPEARAEGLFPNHIVLEHNLSKTSIMKRAAAGDTVVDILKDHAIPGSANVPGKAKMVQVKKLMNELGFSERGSNHGIYGQLASKLGAPLTKKGHLNRLKNMEVPEHVAQDIMNIWQRFEAPPPVSKLEKGIGSLTNLFKVGVLSFPARHTRDATSSQFRNVETGALKPLTAKQQLGEAHNFYHGENLKPAKVGGKLMQPEEIPVLKQLMDQRGLPHTTENASEVARQLVGSIWGGHLRMQDVAGAAPSIATGQMQEALKGIPGLDKSTTAGSVKKAVKTWLGREKGTTLNPRKATIRGVGDATDTTFGPPAASEMAGNYTDIMGRLVPFLHHLREGHGIESARKLVDDAQVSYNPAHYTATERKLKALFPFYSYFSRQLPYVAKELATKPGGAVSQMVKGADRMKSEEPLLPDYVANNTAIPLPGGPGDGTKRFLTGLGLMHEDSTQAIGAALGAITRGPQEPVIEAVSRLNPMFLKYPIEIASGKSMFQRGPDGGRPLESIDPTFGRTLSNILGREKPITFPGSRHLEHALSNSPLSRLGTTARTLSDPRKRIPGTPLPGASLINTLTGFRVSDVSPQSQETVIRENIQKLQKSMGGKEFVKSFIPDDVLREMSPEDRAKAEQMMALSAVLAGRAKKRKELKKKAER